MLRTASLTGKKVLLGITGGIAAYKTPHLVRLLKKSGADVRVVCTPCALDFVTEKSLSVVSENPVLIHFYSDNGTWNEHVQLGLWADIMLLAPCTANTVAKLAMGICDNFLLATVLSARCPVWVAPAMDLDMFTHPATQRNLSQLAALNYHCIEPESGELASGLTGKGRMPEPETLVGLLGDFFHDSSSNSDAPSGATPSATPPIPRPSSWYRNKHVLITTGGTRESIDPVRYIGNHSSGKMGIALAEALVEAGAIVHLVAAHVSTPLPLFCQIYRVDSADDMLSQCLSLFPSMDAAWMVAAVADFKPLTAASEKIKKSDTQETITLTLTKNPDILATLGKNKQPHQRVCGFALETENEIFHAQEKLRKKNADCIVLNSLKSKSVNFGSDYNEVTLFSANREPLAFPVDSKSAIAQHLIHTTSTWFSE
jgi:phosphopantothenoylcysteine decarboxylase/phosphopantothenate--cysteine ligase